MSVRVGVLGGGALSSLGADLDEQWRRLRAGASGLAPTDSRYPQLRWFGAVDDADVQVPQRQRRACKRLNRPSILGVIAADRAVGAAGTAFAAVPAHRRGIYVGSNEYDSRHMEHFHPVLARSRAGDGTVDYAALGRRGLRYLSPDFLLVGLSNAALCQITIAHEIHGTNSTLVDASSTGLQAVGRAFRAVRAGRADMMAAGGAHSVADELSRHGLRACNQLAFASAQEHSFRPLDADRGGYVPGEGAGFAVLGDLRLAREHDTPVLAEVLGYGAATGAGGWRTVGADGAEVRAAIERALADAGVAANDIGYVHAHGDGTMLGDGSELRGIVGGLRGRSGPVPVVATKAATGHLGPAGDVLEALFAALAVRDAAIPPTLRHRRVDADLDGSVRICGSEQRLGARYVLTISRNSYGPQASALVFGPAGKDAR